MSLAKLPHICGEVLVYNTVLAGQAVEDGKHLFYSASDFPLRCNPEAGIGAVYKDIVARIDAGKH